MDNISSFGACNYFLGKLLVEGTSIVAEVLRLADFIPPEFKDPTKSKFKPFILDFTYFSKAQQLEIQLSNEETLQDLFYATHGPLLNRFELFFQAVANYLISFNEYCEKVSNDKNSVGFDQETELEVQCLYTCGLIVLYIEKYLPGTLRERLYIAIFRNSDDRSNVEFLVDFLRVAVENNDTLFRRALKHEKFCTKMYKCPGSRPSGYNPRFLQKVHSNQLFSLRNDAKMRQITDTLFRDHWVLALGYGLIVNLFDSWQPFKAANTALNAIIDINKASSIASEHYRVVAEISLPQGDMNPSQFSQNVKLITEYNRSLRWLVLHSYDKCCGRRGFTMMQAMDAAIRFEKAALVAVLKIAKFEMEFLKTYKTHLQNREEATKKAISGTSLFLTELADIFAQGFASLKVEKKERLNEWFLVLKKAVEDLDVDNPTASVEVVQQIKQRINQVGEMLDLNGNFAVSQYLEKIKGELDGLSSILQLSEDVVRNVEDSADSDYLWSMIDDWTPRVQKRLLSASNTQPVRAFFHKLSLSLAVLDRRLPQGPHSEAVKRISRAFSFYLDRRLRNILQSVPHHLFSIMHEIVEPSLKHQWEPFLDKSEAKKLADFEENFRLADATYTISNMSVGISRMALKKVGTVDVNPKELLEEGIRRELANELPDLLKIAEKDPSLSEIITKSEEKLRCLHTAFIYTCEHMDVNGHEIWRDELRQLCVVVAEERIERVKEIRRKSTIGQATLDCIVDLMYKSTNPSTSRYLDNEMVWIDAKSKKELLSSQEFIAVEKMIPCHALTAFDRVLAHDLQQTLHENLRQWRTVLSNVTGLPNSEIGPDSDYFKTNHFEQLNKVIYANSATLAGQIAKIGQIILLRKHINDTKRDGGRRRAAPIFESLQACNSALLAKTSDLPSSIEAVCNLLTACSLFNPQRVHFVIPHSLAAVQISTPMFLLHATVASKLGGSRKDSLCSTSFILGVEFALRQMKSVQGFVSTANAYYGHQMSLPKKYRLAQDPRDIANDVVSVA
ncbi:unnamed protein product [Caenorhabditis auriculariae]|uniref:WASH complex subunit strumpellin n=1 Tax=Caenorhabditis auriculariae TaxID=2777116 RepID=A0A8S1HKG4_9PELO|nr:unnamed protein product [Caenorhabditis auriculariae]